jgi:hypothetical protein
MAGSTRLNILKQRIGAKTIHSSATEEHIFYKFENMLLIHLHKVI